MERGAHGRPVIAPAARLIVGGIFLYAGAVKLLDPGQFAFSIDRYRLVSHPLAVALALCLPWLELLGGIGVFRARIRRGALAILLVLGLAFLAVMASAWFRHLDIGCGCFGNDSGNHAQLGFGIGRNLCLVGLTGWMLWREHFPHAGAKSAEARPGQEKQPLELPG
jgi:putative oxidoreductase